MYVRFILVFELFTSFDMFPFQCQRKNTFDKSKVFSVIGLKGLCSFTFKVWEPKCIKILDTDEF